MSYWKTDGGEISICYRSNTKQEAMWLHMSWGRGIPNIGSGNFLLQWNEHHKIYFVFFEFKFLRFLKWHFSRQCGRKTIGDRFKIFPSLQDFQRIISGPVWKSYKKIREHTAINPKVRSSCSVCDPKYMFAILTIGDANVSTFRLYYAGEIDQLHTVIKEGFNSPQTVRMQICLLLMYSFASLTLVLWRRGHWQYSVRVQFKHMNT